MTVDPRDFGAIPDKPPRRREAFAIGDPVPAWIAVNAVEAQLVFGRRVLAEQLESGIHIRDISGAPTSAPFIRGAASPLPVFTDTVYFFGADR